MNTFPVLYSFRRCPYAMRARMALVYSGTRVELREVKLSQMPDSMLQISPKATVPVLQLADGQVIDESIDVMHWSLGQSDPEDWLEIDGELHSLIERNDHEFKPLLDCYKYADRNPQISQLEHRQRAEPFLAELNNRLNRQSCLGGSQHRLVDFAIFPFIRQFAGVEPGWFEGCEYTALRSWMNNLLHDQLFVSVMTKNPFWQPGDDAIYL